MPTALGIPGLGKVRTLRARRAGASAKFAGSGGAIIGICPDERTFKQLRAALEPIRCDVIRPVI